MARKFGALTLAIVNDEKSPAAGMSELVLPIGAGPEHSVAATKSVALSMIAGAQLVASLARDGDLNKGLQQLPLRLSGALTCDWSAWADSAAGAPATFVTGRGYGLGCVREIALKVAEILRVPRSATARPSCGTGRALRSRRQRLCLCCDRTTRPPPPSTNSSATWTTRASRVFTAGGAAGTLPWIGDGHPVCDPVLMLIPAYRAIEAVARRRGTRS